MAVGGPYDGHGLSRDTLHCFPSALETHGRPLQEFPGARGTGGRTGVQGPARGLGWPARGSGAGQGDRGPARVSGVGQGASMVLGREIIEMKIYCLGIFARAPPRLGIRDHFGRLFT